MALDMHRSQGRGIKVAYLHDADLVRNRRILRFESLVTDLEYADDMALLADNWSDLTAMLDSLSTCCKKLGLTISCKKAKSLAVLPSEGPQIQSPVPIHLVPGDEPIKVVSHFQYLGSIVRNDCGMDAEINSRICKASSAFQSLSRTLWYQRKIKTSTKLRILNSVILPTLLYGLESTVLLEPHVRRLESFVILASESFWGFQSGRRSVTPPYARWLNSKGFHQFSYNAVFVFLDTSRGCPMTAYPSSFWCLPLLVASALLGDRRVGGMM